MKIVNVGLIGYGKMGKIFAKEIKNKKEFILKKIISKKDFTNKILLKNFFQDKHINLVIITSPIETHFNYLKLALKENKNIIIEKPLVQNLKELNKIINLNKFFNKKILIHHNDILNLEKKNSNYFENFHYIKKVVMKYGCMFKNSSFRLPHIDWLPHPLSVTINFFGWPVNIKIEKYLKRKKSKSIIEILNLKFVYNNCNVYINFSNFYKKKFKKIIIYQKKYKKIYNGYEKNNQRTVELLLNKFLNVKKVNDISKFNLAYKLLFKISRMLTKY